MYSFLHKTNLQELSCSVIPPNLKLNHEYQVSVTQSKNNNLNSLPVYIRERGNATMMVLQNFLVITQKRRGAVIISGLVSPTQNCGLEKTPHEFFIYSIFRSNPAGDSGLLGEFLCWLVV